MNMCRTVRFASVVSASILLSIIATAVNAFSQVIQAVTTEAGS